MSTKKSKTKGLMVPKLPKVKKKGRAKKKLGPKDKRK